MPTRSMEGSSKQINTNQRSNARDSTAALRNQNAVRYLQPREGLLSAAAVEADTKAFPEAAIWNTISLVVLHETGRTMMIPQTGIDLARQTAGTRRGWSGSAKPVQKASGATGLAEQLLTI